MRPNLQRDGGCRGRTSDVEGAGPRLISVRRLEDRWRGTQASARNHRGHLAAPLWWRPPELPHESISSGHDCQGDGLTSLVVWVAVDQRGPASVYIATDSRISWPAGPTGATQWDGARKTYSTTKLAHIMGYVGDVLFPALTLPTVAAQLDACLHDESVEVAQERVLELVTAAWRDVPASERLESRLVHCTRVGAGMKARFGVQILHLPAGTTEWTATALELPPVSSKIDFWAAAAQDWKTPTAAG